MTDFDPLRYIVLPVASDLLPDFGGKHLMADPRKALTKVLVEKTEFHPGC